MKNISVFTVLFLSIPYLVYSNSGNGVNPIDIPPVQWSIIDPVITKYITSGYSALMSPWSSMLSIPDKALSGIRAQVFGGTIVDGSPALTSADQATYKDILNLPATSFDALQIGVSEGINQNVLRSLYGGYDKNHPSVSGVFLGGTFVGDPVAISNGIKSGAFNNLNYWRLILSEYLIGRLYIAASGFKGSLILNMTYSDKSSDATILNNFINQASTYLAQIRYLRSAFPIPGASVTLPTVSTASTPTSTAQAPISPQNALGSIFGFSSSKNSTQSSSTQSNATLTSSTLRPIDMFAGVIVVNEIKGVQLGYTASPIQYQSAGFIPTGEYVNYWTNLNTDTVNNWYIQRKVNNGGEGASNAGYVYVSQKGPNLVFNTDYSPQDFMMTSTAVTGSIDAYNAFFSETTPWAFVILCTSGSSVNGQSTVVTCKTLGLVKLNPLLFSKSPSTDSIIAHKRNGVCVIQGNPNNNTLASATSVSSTAGGNYELTDLWYAPQQLYMLTYPSKFSDGSPYPYAYIFLQGLYNGYLQTSRYQALVNDGSMTNLYDADSNNQVTSGIYIQNRWNTPTVDQWLAADSYLDWKFLRFLIVTYYAGCMIYVNDQAFGFNNITNRTYLEDIFVNPKADIPSVYIGASSDNVSYVPVLPFPIPPAPKPVVPVPSTPTPTPTPTPIPTPIPTPVQTTVSLPTQTTISSTSAQVTTKTSTGSVKSLPVITLHASKKK